MCTIGIKIPFLELRLLLSRVAPCYNCYHELFGLNDIPNYFYYCFYFIFQFKFILFLRN